MRISRFSPKPPVAGATTSRNSCKLASPSIFPFPPNGRRKRRCGRPGPPIRTSGATTWRRPAERWRRWCARSALRTGCDSWLRAMRPKRTARAALGNAAEIVPARYGDIWLRDTGPIFARSERGPVALRFMHQRLGRQVRSARGHHRRRRHRQACRHAGAQIRFRPRGRRYRAGRRRHAPRHAADSAQRESQWLDAKPKPKPRYGRPSAPRRSSGSTEVS